MNLKTPPDIRYGTACAECTVKEHPNNGDDPPAAGPFEIKDHLARG